MAKVYVLGAGASKAFRFNAPLMGQLVGDIVELCLEKLNVMKKDRPLEKRFSEILVFISHLYASPFDKLTLDSDELIKYEAIRRQVLELESDQRLPNLEDILSQIDYALIDNRPISSSWSIDNLRKLRLYLIYLMCRIIRDKIAIHSPKDLSDDLKEQFLQSLHGDTIISLNYDLIIDSLLYEYTEFADYDMPIRGIYVTEQRAHSYNRYHSSRETDIKLHKLHGSLNWLFCPRCRDIDVTQGEKGAIKYIFEKLNSRLALCPICNVYYEPVIVTPTFLKTYDNGLIRQLWDKAEVILEEADEVIFIGYSLPDADIMLRSMFTRALSTNRINRYSNNNSSNVLSKECRITLVDKVNPNDPNSIRQGGETRKRYERLFGKIDENNYFSGDSENIFKNAAYNSDGLLTCFVEKWFKLNSCH